MSWRNRALEQLEAFGRAIGEGIAHSLGTSEHLARLERLTALAVKRREFEVRRCVIHAHRVATTAAPPDCFGLVLCIDPGDTRRESVRLEMKGIYNLSIVSGPHFVLDSVRVGALHVADGVTYCQFESTPPDYLLLDVRNTLRET